MTLTVKICVHNFVSAFMMDMRIPDALYRDAIVRSSLEDIEEWLKIRVVSRLWDYKSDITRDIVYKTILGILAEQIRKEG